MNRTKKITGLLALLLLPTIILSQEFYRHYNTTYDRTARDIMRTSNGEYLIVGASNNSNPADADLYVLRTAADGTFLWDTVYGGAKPDYAYSMTETHDGNYIVAGYSQSGGAGDYDIYLLKLNAQGKLLAQKHIDYGNSGKNDEARAVIRSGDKYYVVGSTGMPPSSSTKSDIVVLKIDVDLNVEDSKTYGGADQDYGLAIDVTGEGGFLIGGQTRSEGAGRGDAFVVKINPSLVQEWTKTYGDDLDEEVVGLSVNISDNTAMLAIRDSMPGTAVDGNIDVLLQLIDLSTSGTPTGTAVRYGDHDKDTPKSIRPVSTGGYIVGAISRSWWPDAPQMWLIRTDKFGNKSWIYDYGDLYEHDHCHMIKESHDGGFVAVGHQRMGVMRLSFLKINAAGTVGIKETASSVSGIKAYPNPSADGKVSLLFEKGGDYQIQVFSITGELIGNNEVNLLQPGVHALVLPATGAGIYIVNVKGEGTSFTARLIVEN